MPNYSRDVYTTDECRRIELSYLFKNKLIEKGCIIPNIVLSWSNGFGKSSSIGIETCLTDEEQYIRLHYTITKSDGSKKDMDYKIYLHSQPSNLGKGEVYYFICPVSNKKCRILYMAYGSEIYKSKQAYRNRIYYPIQTVSKNYYYLQRYFDLERLAEKMARGKMKTHYRGKPTKTYLRYMKLFDRLETADHLGAMAFKRKMDSYKK